MSIYAFSILILAALGGWRPTAHYSALCRGYRLGCGAGELCEPHSTRLVPSDAEMARYGKRHTSLRWGGERAEQFGGWQRCGAGELCEPHLQDSVALLLTKA
jgi:hypothetical protein